MNTQKTTITGKTLIALGYPPDEWFKGAIEHINSNELSNEAMESYLEQF